MLVVNKVINKTSHHACYLYIAIKEYAKFKALSVFTQGKDFLVF